MIEQDIYNRVTQGKRPTKDLCFEMMREYHEEITVDQTLDDFEEDDIVWWCTENLNRERLKEIAGIGGESVIDDQKRQIVERLYDSLTIQRLEEIESKYLSK